MLQIKTRIHVLDLEKFVQFWKMLTAKIILPRTIFVGKFMDRQTGVLNESSKNCLMGNGNHTEDIWFGK